MLLLLQNLGFRAGRIPEARPGQPNACGQLENLPQNQDEDRSGGHTLSPSPCRLRGQPGLVSKFQVSQGYPVNPVSEIQGGKGHSYYVPSEVPAYIKGATGLEVLCE